MLLGAAILAAPHGAARAGDEAALVAFPQGVYAPASTYPDRFRLEGERLYARTSTGEVALAEGSQSAAGCDVRVARWGRELYVAKPSLECLGGAVPAREPRLAELPVRPLLDMVAPVRPGAVRIVIDAGHGGHDAGATGVSGAVEKHISLALARALRDRLRDDPRFEVYLTREDDRYLTLRERAEFANRVRADLFLSIHCNSGRRVGARGVEIFIPGFRASDEETRVLTELENAGEVHEKSAGGGVDGLLGDLALADQLQHSARAAEILLQELTLAAETENRGLKQAPFWVLLGSNMPAVLVETGFVTNPEEGRLLTDPVYRDRLAVAAAGALVSIHPRLLARRVRNADAQVAKSRPETAAPNQANP